MSGVSERARSVSTTAKTSRGSRSPPTPTRCFSSTTTSTRCTARCSSRCGSRPACAADPLPTGTVISHTLAGAWRYLEHNWVARAGSTIYEPAGAACTPESYGDEEAEVFLVITGELLYRDEHGKSSLARTTSRRWSATRDCREHGIAAQRLDGVPMNGKHPRVAGPGCVLGGRSRSRPSGGSERASGSGPPAARGG